MTGDAPSLRLDRCGSGPQSEAIASFPTVWNECQPECWSAKSRLGRIRRGVACSSCFSSVNDERNISRVPRVNSCPTAAPSEQRHFFVAILRFTTIWKWMSFGQLKSEGKICTSGQPGQCSFMKLLDLCGIGRTQLFASDWGRSIA